MISMPWIDANMVGMDFETSGEITGEKDGKPTSEYALQPWRLKQGKAWATSLVWARIYDGKPEISGGLNPDGDMIRRFLQEMIDTGATVVMWNGVFDIAWLLAYAELGGFTDLVFKVRYLDGMLLLRHLQIEPEYDMNRANKRSYGLKPAVAEFLPQFAGYEEDVDFHDPSPEARKKLHRYNVRDVLFTLMISKHIYAHLSPQQCSCALIERNCLALVADANLRGMPVDTIHAHDLSQHLQDTAAAKLVSLAPHGVTEKIVRSPKQLGELMYDVWKLPVLKENKSKLTGNTTRSTDKEVLHELAFQDPRAKELREYREALNNDTKFAIAPLRAAEYNGDGRAHPQAIVFSTYSGRKTYSSKQGRNKDERPIGFALHQEKRGSLFRDILVAPPGYALMEFDAAGQEYRWMAIASNDPTMLQLCQPGEDPHSFMGARVAHVDYRTLTIASKVKDSLEEQQRYLGKVANLSLQYRTSARKLRSVARVDYNIPIELPEAQRIHRTYAQTYRRVPIYWDEQIRLTKRQGYVETFGGRRVQVVGNWDGNLGWSMGSTAINYRIQGTGADQKYLALAILHDYVTEHGIHFAWDLHDGLYWWVPIEKVERARVEMGHLLNNLPYRKAWGFTPPIQLPWDCKLGYSWGTLKEVK